MPNDFSPIRHTQLFELLRQQNASVTVDAQSKCKKKQAEEDEAAMMAFRDLALASWMQPEPPEPAA